MRFRSSLPPQTRRRILFFTAALLLAGTVRLLTFSFLRSHLNEAAWFQYGSYRVFDKRAQDILSGSGRLFWIDDPSRTDLVQYPPAYPWMVAAIYRLTGEASPYSVQRVQWVLDLILSTFLITAVAVTAFGWHVGMGAIVIAGLSPLLAIVGVSPGADAPTTWLVIGALWLLLIAAKRKSVRWALAAGAVLGGACWLRVNPLYLSIFWAVPLLILLRADWRRRLLMAAAVLLGTVLVVSPIVIRNYLVFPDFTPTGGTIGANLWEGLGETELGRENGFALGDDKMVERERIQMRLPADFPIEAMWPDGIKRERQRAREAVAFIEQHPFWYAGVMVHRMWGMLKIAGAPLPYYGTSGINVTSRKCLPGRLQGGVLSFGVNALGMMQSVTRYALLPLAAIGLCIGALRDRLMTALLVATILYYLVPGSFAHTEIRYVLPLHWLLPVFASLAVVALTSMVRHRRNTRSASSSS